jgi:hypothetical protein
MEVFLQSFAMVVVGRKWSFFGKYLIQKSWCR